ncbi:MAG: sigma-70 family RNA polymerase sigma factor [Myxococcales bacterium]|nr:sigma-70 family RNA polymerase sigma factor [Myxococcales bacterium]
MPAAPSLGALGAAAEDMVLVQGLVAGDPRSWREFSVRYDRLIQRCIAKVIRRFGSRVTAEDAREIQGQLILSLLANDKHKLKSFDPTRGSRLSSWIGMLAMNAAYDYLRSIRREPNKAALSEAFDLPCSSSDPFESAAERERADLAARMLSDFSERDRIFATLYFAEGMDPVEIADRLNISVKTVYSKKHKIQSKLEALAHHAA